MPISTVQPDQPFSTPSAGHIILNAVADVIRSIVDHLDNYVRTRIGDTLPEGFSYL